MNEIRNLTPDVQAKVISKFTHTEGQTNASARCQAFARSIARTEPGGGAGGGGGGGGVFAGGGGYAGGGYAASPPQTMQGFQMKWGLDDKCMEFLGMLPPQAQQAVVDGFTHSPGQTN